MYVSILPYEVVCVLQGELIFRPDEAKTILFPLPAMDLGTQGYASWLHEIFSAKGIG